MGEVATDIEQEGVQSRVIGPGCATGAPVRDGHGRQSVMRRHQVEGHPIVPRAVIRHVGVPHVIPPAGHRQQTFRIRGQRPADGDIQGHDQGRGGLHHHVLSLLADDGTRSVEGEVTHDGQPRSFRVIDHHALRRRTEPVHPAGGTGGKC